jgi:nitric oxide reductase subunit B
MKYQSQKIALAYFAVALGLFLIQIIGGLLVGWVYVSPNFLSELVPFSTLRMLHTNSLIVWLLLGFFGAAYFLIPEEAEREIHSTKLAYLQLIILVVGTLGVVVTYLFNIFEGHWLLGKEGREFLEQPVWVKIGIVVAALIFLFNVSMTVLKGRKTAISNILLLGLWGLALLFLFAFYNPHNLSLDKQYWWYVVHLWVEGVWELIMASILAFLMLKLTGVDREVVEKWLYVIVAAALFSGILGDPVLCHDGLCLRHGLEGAARSSQQGGAAVVARLRHAGVLRRGRLGISAYAAWGQLLYPRHADHRGPRPPRLLRRLCLPQYRDLHLCAADPAGS